MAIALLTRVYDDALPTGKPHAVNPLTALENTRDVFDTVARVNGSYVTFSTAIGGGANLSDGIVMTSFRADGTVIGSPKLIVADHNASAFVQANPEAPSATCMARCSPCRAGHIGLRYKKSSGLGSPEVLFQEFAQAGAAVAGPVVLQDSAALAGRS